MEDGRWMDGAKIVTSFMMFAWEEMDTYIRQCNVEVGEVPIKGTSRWTHAHKILCPCVHKR